MEKPRVAGKRPLTLHLEKGKYKWCACGRSANQPFCDGSHEGTPFQPLSFKIRKSKQYVMCLCKRTCNAPFCDGVHAFIDFDNDK